MNRFQGKFFLPFFYSCIQWLEGLIILFEELISVLSVPLLSFGIIISMIDFFQGGALSHDAQFSRAWAIIQSISLDAQIAFTWYKARRASAQKKRVAFGGFMIIGTLLAFVVWASSSLEGQHQIANNSGQQGPQIIMTISHPEEWPYGYAPSEYAPHHDLPVATTEAIVDNTSVSLLGINVPSNLLVSIRMGIAVVLLCIAGWTRKMVKELDTEVATNESQTEATKADKKPFWLVQKWLDIRQKISQKKATAKDTKKPLASQKKATNEPQSEPQKSHDLDTGELQKPATTADTILAESGLDVATPSATPKVTKKLNMADEMATQKGTKKPPLKLVRSAKQKQDKALGIIQKNPEIKPPALAEKAEISLSYAKQLLKKKKTV